MSCSSRAIRVRSLEHGALLALGAVAHDLLASARARRRLSALRARSTRAGERRDARAG
jgi:hypothetical protein